MSNIIHSKARETPTPSKEGFAMPAEWSEHLGCYMSWPCKERTWHGHFDQAKAAYADVIKAISQFEPLTVLATSSAAAEAREVLGPEIDIIQIALDDSWLRDNGPIFVRNADNWVAIVKFGFNAWGGKFPPYDADDKVPITLSEHLRMRHFVAPMILEGGAISVDGEGTLLTTEQCLLNVNRNPRLAKGHIEGILSDFLGVKKVIWLRRGVEDDLTDGHVDGVATFSSPHTIVAAHTKDASDPNFATLEDNISRLESSEDAKGKPIEVIRMVQPRPREVDGLPITPGYTNHYIANKGVVVPTYGIPEDRLAIEILMSAYPGREVVGVNCKYIEIGGGAVHCITQQRPAGTPAPP